MTARALRLCLVLALQLRCVAVPLQDVEESARQAGAGASVEAAKEKINALFHLRDLPRGPPVAPQKKAPQFMLDLFNVVSVSDSVGRSQKEILDGNIVRSFEDKGA